MEDKDMAVNLPSGDFLWRYGGYVPEYDPETIDSSIEANDGFKDNIPPDRFCDIIRLYTLFRKICVFLNDRGLKHPSHEIFIDYKFDFLASKLSNMDEYLGNKYDKTIFSKPLKIFESKTGIDLVRATEYSSISYIAFQMYNCCVIFLHQSELSKHAYVDADPRRVKSSKMICLKKAIEITRLTNWKISNVPITLRSSSVTPWKMCGAVILLNLCFFKDYNDFDFTNRIYDDLLQGSLKSSEHAYTLENLFSILKISHSIKRTAFLKNKNYVDLHEIMAEFSVAPNDIDPWIVPRYSTFFKFPCCLKSNYNTLDISEYLHSNGNKRDKSPSRGTKNFSDSDNESDDLENIEFLSLQFSDISIGQKSHEKVSPIRLRDREFDFEGSLENRSSMSTSTLGSENHIPKKSKCS
ncbi:hypothetical protein AYI68_g2962 [Smittium mucronatum]|uniref:Uncharacterized protein n=1 Tax=Smittium mucronatum TaxID=133383 RepID=A0A1R0H189_9FUNG|nr:hypothetical protein AYI68_g2962 [Smittium mucronatum]